MRGDTLRRCSSSGDLAAYEHAQQSCGAGGEGVTRLRQLHAPGQASRADPARPAFWSGRGCSAARVLTACVPRRRPFFDCELGACARRCGACGRSSGRDQGRRSAAGGHGYAEVRQRLCRQARLHGRFTILVASSGPCPGGAVLASGSSLERACVYALAAVGMLRACSCHRGEEAARVCHARARHVIASPRLFGFWHLACRASAGHSVPPAARKILVRARPRVARAC